jgi:predicted PurR-regulated permease PerM
MDEHFYINSFVTLMINKTLLVATAILVLFAGLAIHNALAQNATTNVTNRMKNITSTASEMGQNASKAMGNASATANQTMSEAGKNATQTGQNLLNQAGEVGKKIGSGVADVLSNISGEIKKGLDGK